MRQSYGFYFGEAMLTKQLAFHELCPESSRSVSDGVGSQLYSAHIGDSLFRQHLYGVEIGPLILPHGKEDDGTQ
ncbi:hypothetical protein LCM20_14285 [Halobacillus litoralis]|uniref:hypothetical protein n=1 Tax=Halobacillus litoralis TaxID=45668 RepID=UPI001CD25766|nr:hypothetical protein [Halobacillus litoralis]MCA0971772.1 hypothetical protein [Halobacillus litoralis]